MWKKDYLDDNLLFLTTGMKKNNDRYQKKSLRTINKILFRISFQKVFECLLKFKKIKLFFLDKYCETKTSIMSKQITQTTQHCNRYTHHYNPKMGSSNAFSLVKTKQNRV